MAMSMPRPQLQNLDALAPAGSLDALVAQLKAQIPNLELSIKQRDGVFELSRIVIPSDRRQTGLGSEVMQQLCDYADRHGLAIALTPDPVYGSSKTRLTQFYRRFGFVPNKGRNKDFRVMESMIRPERSREVSR